MQGGILNADSGAAIDSVLFNENEETEHFGIEIALWCIKLNLNSLHDLVIKSKRKKVFLILLNWYCSQLHPITMSDLISLLFDILNKKKSKK